MKIYQKSSSYLGANVDFVLLLRRVPSYQKGIGTGLLEQVQLHPPRLSNPLPKRHGVIEKSQIITGFVIFVSNFYENSKNILRENFREQSFRKAHLRASACSGSSWLGEGLRRTGPRGLGGRLPLPGLGGRCNQCYRVKGTMSRLFELFLTGMAFSDPA